MKECAKVHKFFLNCKFFADFFIANASNGFVNRSIMYGNYL